MLFIKDDLIFNKSAAFLLYEKNLEDAKNKTIYERSEFLKTAVVALDEKTS